MSGRSFDERIKRTLRRYRVVVPDRPLIFDDRHYIVRDDVVLVDQPTAGFLSSHDALMWLTEQVPAREDRSGIDIVPGWQVQGELDERKSLTVQERKGVLRGALRKLRQSPRKSP